MENAPMAIGLLFIWLLILTVSFVLHWIKIERHMHHHHGDSEHHLGARVSEGLKDKVLGKS